MVAYQLGYKRLHEGLEGGYPDIRNQMLEVKVQDSPMIDLGSNFLGSVHTAIWRIDK